ncbi:MAG: hypothetical protein ABFS12_15530 [Bacteroidota bacterium]
METKSGKHEVVFKMNTVYDLLKKGTLHDNPTDFPICNDKLDATYINFSLGKTADDPNPQKYLLNIAHDNETKPLKLEVGVYYLQEFYVYSNVGKLWAAAPADSPYIAISGGRIKGLEFPFEVKAFQTLTVEVDVLCWEEIPYTEY